MVEGDLGKTPNQVIEERAGRVEFAACRRSVALALQDLSLKAHTQWVEMSVHHNGFTTAWTPNRATPGGPGLAHPDVNVISVRERNGGPTFAAVTSRSFHPGGVMSLRADGSVRFVPQTIDGSVWSALGTVAGGEVIAGG